MAARTSPVFPAIDSDITTALDTPFLLLPFRPGSDASSARSFIRSFFRDAYEGGGSYRGESLRAELRLTEPMVGESSKRIAHTWADLDVGSL